MSRILWRMSRYLSTRSDVQIKHDVRRLSRALSSRSDVQIKHNVRPVI